MERAGIESPATAAKGKALSTEMTSKLHKPSIERISGDTEYLFDIDH